jgi:hypothetical protein
MYAIGIGLKSPLSKNRNVAFLKKLVNGKSYYLLTLLFAFLPFMPLDDYLYIGGGVSGASASKVNAVAFAGKVIKSSVEIPVELAGLFYVEGLIHVIKLGAVELSLISCLLFVALSYVIMNEDLNLFNGHRFSLRLFYECTGKHAGMREFGPQ